MRLTDLYRNRKPKSDSTKKNASTSKSAKVSPSHSKSLLNRPRSNYKVLVCYTTADTFNTESGDFYPEPN
jgi:hypothetical protein